MVKPETLALIYWNDPDNDPSGWTDVMTLDEAVEKAKLITKSGLECYIFKLTQTHYYKAER